MTTKLKLYIGRKILDSVRKNTLITPMHIKPLLRLEPAPVSDDNHFELSLPMSFLENNLSRSDVSKILRITPDDIIQNIHYNNDTQDKRICFQIDRHIFTKEVIENCCYPDLNQNRKNIVVEFSSPNVAKPFHMGNLRSTIIGNFVANLYKHLQHNVIKLNYLGDWGTQFGMIKVGVKNLNHNENDIKVRPLQVLYESYVHANKLATNDPQILEDAKLEFSKMESGSEPELEEWKNYLSYTINELKSMYERLGVHFDEYNYESMYGAKHVKDVLDSMAKKKLLRQLQDGRRVFKLDDERDVTVVKSDGSTLYLTRDIAAALDRYHKYEFDRMFYVVDNSQSAHFNALWKILHEMDLPWAHRIRHVKFGRIKGMSTRKGTAVFLNDILDEVRDLMVQRQIESPNTKAPISDTTTTDILGISCVIINDLKQRRQKDYEFSWDKALQVQGDTGIKLQYTHCRLCSLEKNSGAVAAKDCNPELLTEPEVLSLIRQLARFNDVLAKTEEQLEANVLVKYLFLLCNNISKSLKVLKVKDQEGLLSAQRLLLFNTSREVLRQGMVILGLRPLKEM